MLNTVSALAISAENITRLWQTPLLGMAMIFAVLALLWGVLAVFKLIFVGKTETKPEKEKKSEEIPQPVSVAPAPVQPQNEDEQLIAVLTAAIAAYRATETGGEIAPNGFRVVSFRRTNGGRSWNAK